MGHQGHQALVRAGAALVRALAPLGVHLGETWQTTVPDPRAKKALSDSALSLRALETLVIPNRAPWDMDVWVAVDRTGITRHPARAPTPEGRVDWAAVQDAVGQCRRAHLLWIRTRPQARPQRQLRDRAFVFADWLVPRTTPLRLRVVSDRAGEVHVWTTGQITAALVGKPSPTQTHRERTDRQILIGETLSLLAGDLCRATPRARAALAAAAQDARDAPRTPRHSASVSDVGTMVLHPDHTLVLQSDTGMELARL